MPNEAIGDTGLWSGDVLSVDGETGAVNLDGIRASVDVGGKVPVDELPERAKTKIFTVASEVEQLALSVNEGDTCVRTDLNRTYVAKNSDNIDLDDWQLLPGGEGAVESVDGRVGIVTLDDLYAASSHEHLVADITDLQDELDAKEDIANKGIADGYAELDGTGKVPATQLPSTPAADFQFAVKGSGSSSFQASDTQKWVEFQNGASAADFTIVPESTHVLSAGAWFYSSKTGSGEVEYKRDVGVSFRTPLPGSDVDFKIDSDGADSAVLLFVYRGSDDWYVMGPIKSV